MELTRYAFLLPVAFVLVYLVNLVLRHFLSGLRQIPGPQLAAYSRLWNVRNASAGNAHESFRELHRKYGALVRVGPNHVAISDPAMVPVLYGTNNNFRKSDFYLVFNTPYQGQTMQSMFSTRDLALHKKLKQGVSSKYSLSALRGMEPQIDECNDLFVSKMERMAQNNEIVDLGGWLQWYAFDTIGAITFNRRFGFMDQEKDIQDIIAGIEGGLWYGSIVGQVPELHPYLLGNNGLMRVLGMIIPGAAAANPVPKVVSMVEEAIKTYDGEQDRDPSRGDFLAWFRREAEKSADKMPHKDLMNHLMNNLLAGSDTTAISLRAIFYYLIKNSRCYEKLMVEIESQDAGENGNFAMTTTTAMPYLQACIKEAMRLHPGVGFPLERYVPKDGLTYGNINLPEGTIIGMNAWVVHHDEAIYGADADDFRPERWLDSDPEKIKLMDRCFLSFGAGTRTCIGKNISIMEMNKMVPQVLRRFRIEWASPGESWKITTHWFAKQTGLKVRFHLR